MPEFNLFKCLFLLNELSERLRIIDLFLNHGILWLLASVFFDLTKYFIHLSALHLIHLRCYLKTHHLEVYSPIWQEV